MWLARRLIEIVPAPWGGVIDVAGLSSAQLHQPKHLQPPPAHRSANNGQRAQGKVCFSLLDSSARTGTDCRSWNGLPASSVTRMRCNCRHSSG